MATLTPGRAVTSYLARRIITLATRIALTIFGISVLICGVLVYFFSGWWWLLLVPVVLLLSVFFIIRFIALLVVGKIHADRLTNQQQTALKQFTDKVQSLLEARATPLPLLLLISLKDLIIHRDIVTIKQLVRDSASLMSDYKNIEKLFSARELSD